MKIKRPWYKSGFIIGLLIMCVGMAMNMISKNSAPDSNPGTGIGALGMMVIFITSIKRLCGTIARKLKPKPKMEPFTPSTPQTPTTVPTEPPAPTPSYTFSVKMTTPKPTTTPAPAVMTPAKRLHKTENHKVAGVSFRQSEIQSIGLYNYDYDLSKSEFKENFSPWERVYQYEFDSVSAELVPEEHNAETGNYAIKVMANNVHIGYIKSGSVSHVRKLIENDDILDVDIEIKGGKSKMLDEDGDIQRDSIGYYAKVTITLYDYIEE